MQFLITGRDGNDDEALSRRMAARPAHLDNVSRLKNEGKLLLGAALVDDGGKMIGSIMVFNFDKREDVDKYLENEPYIKGNVWQQIDVQSIAIGDAFLPEPLRM